MVLVLGKTGTFWARGEGGNGVVEVFRGEGAVGSIFLTIFFLFNRMSRFQLLSIIQ